MLLLRLPTGELRQYLELKDAVKEFSALGMEIVRWNFNDHTYMILTPAGWTPIQLLSKKDVHKDGQAPTDEVRARSTGDGQQQ